MYLYLFKNGPENAGPYSRKKHRGAFTHSTTLVQASRGLTTTDWFCTQLTNTSNELLIINGKSQHVHWRLLNVTYSRNDIRSFPGWLLSRMVFSRKDVSRKVVSRMVIFPDDTFPGKTSWMVGLIFNCSWRWSLTQRPYCVYLNGFTVNSPHCQFAPLTNTSQVNMGRVGIQSYQVPVVLILSSGRHCHCVAST